MCKLQGPNRVIDNRQRIRENYVTEKMIVGLITMSHYILMLNNNVGSIKLNFLQIFITSMAMSYFTVTFVRSLDQIEDFISGLVRRACSCYYMLLWSWLVVFINVTCLRIVMCSNLRLFQLPLYVEPSFYYCILTDIIIRIQLHVADEAFLSPKK